MDREASIGSQIDRQCAPGRYVYNQGTSKRQFIISRDSEDYFHVRQCRTWGDKGSGPNRKKPNQRGAET
jgi:hypothetical protein